VSDLAATRRVSFPSRPAGAELRGRLRLPAGAPRGAAVLCHPHPDAGGNMDVWLLPALAQALAPAGWASLRFDFRSVGRGVQPGPHDEERADLAGAIALLRAEGLIGDDGRLALIGWSFGALVGLLAGLDEPAVTDWIGIAPPTGPLPGLPLAEVPSTRIAAWPARRTVIVGEHEQFFPAETAAVLAPHRVVVIPSADHFFFDLDREISAAVLSALEEA
jgi:alpha/beta superfamily hydrolase